MITPPFFASFQTAYAMIAHDVLDTGTEAAPRGMKTRELLGVTMEFANPRKSLIDRPGFSVPFAAAEAIQLIGGFSDTKMLERINPTMKQFFEERDGRTYQHGAYGPRIGTYLVKVLDKLRSDPDSRQCVINVFDQTTDYRDTPDVPCTVSLQFMIRDNRVNLHTTMRSNDVWWGLPYDVFQFTQLQLTVANLLGKEAGVYFHTANSLHVYERDFATVHDLMSDLGDRYVPSGLGWAGQDVRSMQHLAKDLTEGGKSTGEAPRWYRDQLSYVSPRYHGSR